MKDGLVVRGWSLGNNEVGVKLSRVLRDDNVKDDLVYILKSGNILNKVWGGDREGSLITLAC